MYLSASATAIASSWSWSFGPIHSYLGDPPPPEHDPNHGEQNWSSFIGIVTAIVGNILIALALNVQRYAHIRLHRQRRERKRKVAKNGNGVTSEAANNGDGPAPREAGGGRGQRGGEGGGGIYGATNASSNGTNGHAPRQSPARYRDDADDDADADAARETDPLTQSFESRGSGDSRWSHGSDDDSEGKTTSTYLKDPYWWLGQVLITVGEMGNFLAYGFAPASIVSPLGVVALISNCVIAPIVFKEVFRQRDFFGVIVAVTGAVTVVLSAKQQETKLEPHDVWAAITTMEFEIYMGVSCSLIVLLMWLSPRYGNRTILIDLGLVGLFGGYTALATKGVSSMLSSTLFRAFTTPVTYALVFILLATAVMQVRYVNKALQRFDSTQVIPIQFVTFTLCVIIGSAVLYRDFERTTPEQAAKFVGGCLLTFFGAFLITSGRPRQDEDEDTLEDVEGVEETIGLAEQGRQQAHSPHPRSRHGSTSTQSRRASRVSFKDVVPRPPLTSLSESGVPTLRIPPSSNSTPILAVDGTDNSPHLDYPWGEGGPAAPSPLQQRPGTGQHMSSADTIGTVASVAVSDAPSHPATPLIPITEDHPGLVILPQSPPADRPVTPRTSMSSSRPHSLHFGGQVYSPSPFSSTVSAVVADKILSHLDSPTLRNIAARRSRPSLRNSLFVPQDELAEEVARQIASAVEQPIGSSLSEAEEGPEGKKNLRGRARSLSNTLGELFGVRKKDKGKPGETTDEDDESPSDGSAYDARRGSAQ